MPKVPKIAESEWRVMRILWSHREPLPAYDIIQKLAGSEDWQPRTVKTLLNRLVKKGALGYRKYKNLYLYYPLASEGACLRMESESFLKRCFDGALQPMLAHFVEHRELTADEIEALRRILDGRGTRP